LRKHPITEINFINKLNKIPKEYGMKEKLPYLLEALIITLNPFFLMYKIWVNFKMKISLKPKLKIKTR
jgi:hypothetical protein